MLTNQKGFPVSVGTLKTLEVLLRKMKPWEVGGNQMRMINLFVL